MHDEELLRLAGDSLRKQDILDDPRLEALARGELSQEEVEELLALEHSGELPGGAVEAFSAFSEDYLGRLEQSMARRNQDAPVLCLSNARRRKMSYLMGAPMAAAAAAVVAFVLWPASPSEPILPTYTLELEGGLAKVRSVAVPTTEKPVRLSPQTALELRLRPATRTKEPVFVRLIRAGSEELDGWVMDPAIKVSDSGTVTVHISGDQLGGRELVSQRLHVLLAPSSMKDQLPRRANDDLTALPAQVQIFAVEIILEN
jgi:hypothetical protein